jgi:hypothetical protein
MVAQNSEFPMNVLLCIFSIEGSRGGGNLGICKFEMPSPALPIYFPVLEVDACILLPKNLLNLDSI